MSNIHRLKDSDEIALRRRHGDGHFAANIRQDIDVAQIRRVPLPLQLADNFQRRLTGALLLGSFK